MSATLQGIVRDKLGSRHARRLRLQGRIPASLQGEAKDHLEFSIEEHQFLAARRHHEHLFDIEVAGGDLETAMVRELQWDHFGERILHVEFRRVVRGRETEAEVELEFVGHPKGGVLNHLITHVPIAALPTQIPDSIEVKVDELEQGHPLLAGDLILPEGVRILLPEDAKIAVVSTVRAEAEPEAEEAAEGEPAEEGAAAEAKPAEES